MISKPIILFKKQNSGNLFNSSNTRDAKNLVDSEETLQFLRQQSSTRFVPASADHSTFKSQASKPTLVSQEVT